VQVAAISWPYIPSCRIRHEKEKKEGKALYGSDVGGEEIRPRGVVVKGREEN